jgi:hypothetical protein
MILDIKTVSLGLFDARVLALDGIRRCTVSSLDSPSADFWNKKPTTNDWAILTPYEFTYHCFTSELNRVVEALYRNPHAFLVKNIVVDTAPSQLIERPADGSGDSAMPMMPGMNWMQMQMMMRYGMRGGRYAAPIPPPQEVPTPAPTARGGLTPLLDEKPFRVVLWVESVRLRDPEEVKAAARQARASRPARSLTPEADGQSGDTNAPAGDTPAESAPVPQPPP